MHARETVVFGLSQCREEIEVATAAKGQAGVELNMLPKIQEVNMNTKTLG